MITSKIIYFLSIIIIFTFFSGCKDNTQPSLKRVIVAIPADAESLNPLFSFSYQEVNLSELLYLSLVQHDWNDMEGDIVTSPMIAKNWIWEKDSSSIFINLRDDVKWRDGRNLTSEDVIFSFDIYSDPDVQSRFFGTFNHFITESNLHIDLDTTFEINDPYKLVIHFKPGSNPTLFDIDIPILPKHVFGNMNRKDLISLEKGLDSVTSGPFYLHKWEKNEAIILRKNDKSFLNPKLDEFIFKIVTDYNNRITQLKNGTIDFTDNIKPDQVNELKSDPKLVLKPVKGREYDYAAWNDKLLFSSPSVRKALTYAINREEIVTGFLGNNGDLAVGPVAPIFKEYFNNNLVPFEYNPSKAKELLSAEGWKDKDRNGIIEKNGQEFTFTLNYAAGNPRREFAATFIKSNLKIVGIDLKTQSMEQGEFFDKMFSKELNAWLGGWSVPIPLDLKPYWYSNLELSPLNLTSYSSKETDLLLLQIESEKTKEGRVGLYKRVQEELYNDSPVTFLYWIDNVTAYNVKIKNINISPLGNLHKCWEWNIDE